ncbi:hypothetical protein BDZ89DRAFT_1161145 [Hymenopellis radicata]|nr:hypothetical protein BDZ89DRAFT_1161145 [Hymenopellis radicata]
MFKLVLIVWRVHQDGRPRQHVRLDGTLTRGGASQRTAATMLASHDHLSTVLQDLSFPRLYLLQRVDGLTLPRCCLEDPSSHRHQDIDTFGLILADRVSWYGVAQLLALNINLEHSRLRTLSSRQYVDLTWNTLLVISFDFDDDEGLRSSSTLPSTCWLFVLRLDFDDDEGLVERRSSSSTLPSTPTTGSTETLSGLAGRRYRTRLHCLSVECGRVPVVSTSFVYSAVRIRVSLWWMAIQQSTVPFAQIRL